MQDSIYERNKKWFFVMDLVTSVSALVFIISILFLPIKSYGFLLKVDFSFFKLFSENVGEIEEGGLLIASLGFVLMSLSSCVDRLVMKYVKSEEWEEKIKFLLGLVIVACFVFIVGMMVFENGFEQAISEYFNIANGMEYRYGFYLSWFGIVPIAISLVKVLYLRRVANGENEEDVFKTMSFNKNSESSVPDVRKKLEELTSLKNSNMITEEEYNQKKSEIIKDL